MSRIGGNVYTTIRKRITLGEYPPGMQLKEEHLAAELGVSRSPVRAALRRLESDGLICVEAHRGAFVAEWTDRDVDEVFDLRAVLEAHAAALAARRRQPGQLARLQALNEETERLLANRGEDFLAELQRINLAFHETILQASCSPRLMAMARQLHEVQRVTGSFYYYGEDDLLRSLFQHRELTEAIEHQDERMAADLMGSHVRGAFARLRRQRKGVAASGGNAGED
ncbi:GntR family transcriptional regulator [Pseudothauera rhizosphaerae]|nr:GntR family transcriptional regulator [Pseudothauera rhizosphaerae]